MVLAVLLASCGASKTVIGSKKIMKGYWSLNSIAYDQAGTYDVKLLNDANKECFEGSSWRFIPNNNSGIYTINSAADCASGDRYFVFTIDEVNAESGLYDFLLKPTNEKLKSETNTGYRVKLSYLDDTMMTWSQTVQVDGSPFTITWNFTKINE